MPKYYSLHDWEKFIPLSRTTIWRMRRDKELPDPDKIIRKKPMWLESTVAAYISSQTTSPSA